jgi:hypothetical protein
VAGGHREAARSALDAGWCVWMIAARRGRPQLASEASRKVVRPAGVRGRPKVESVAPGRHRRAALEGSGGADEVDCQLGDRIESVAIRPFLQFVPHVVFCAAPLLVRRGPVLTGASGTDRARPRDRIMAFVDRKCIAESFAGGDTNSVESISRNDLIEEIADALALGVLGEESVGYRIRRTPEGSLLVDYEEAEFLFLVSVSELPRTDAGASEAGASVVSRH